MQVKSFEEACQAQGLDPNNCLPDVSKSPAKHQAAITASAKLMIIAVSLNDGWEPNWDDDDEYKWIPWWDMEYDKKQNPSGFRFDDAFYDVANAYSSGGSRLCFKSKELAVYAATTFIELYREMMVIPK